MSLLTNLFRGAASVPMGALKLATRGRTGQATAAVAGGFLASSYLSHLSGVKKNYYGEKEYQSQYRGGIDTAASLAPYAGGALGLSMLLGGGSVPGRISNTGKRMVLRPAYSIASRMSPVNFSVSGNAASSASSLFNAATTSNRRLSLFTGRERQRSFRFRSERRQNPKYRVTSDPYTESIGVQNRAGSPSFDTSESVAGRFVRYYDNIGPGIMPLVLLNATSAGTSLGLKTAAVSVMSAPGTTAAVVGGIVGTTALKVASQIGGMEGFVGMGAIGAAATAGVYAGSRLPVRSAGEGHISDFRVNAQSTSGKMDFNTAGLVQAMHYNRRG